MSNQFNNQRCSKCYQTYSGLKATCSASGCNHEHFFKKNGQLLCVMCLMREGNLKCQKCRKSITRLEEMGKWRGNSVLVDDHTYDINTFCCECRECSHSENEKKKSKRCQGTFSVDYNGGRKVNGSTQYNQCDSSVPIDEGDFCQHCKGQTETYQQLRARLNKEKERSLEEFCQAMDKAQKYWDLLSSSEREKECGRLVENIKLGKYWCGEGWMNRSVEGYCSGWAHNWRCWEIRNGKFTSTTPHLAPVELGEEFLKKRGWVQGTWRQFIDGFSVKRLQSNNEKMKKDNNDDKDNSPNLVAPTPQPITNSNDKNDNSVNPGNSPQLNQGQDKLSEVKNDVKTVKFENKEDNGEKTPPKSTVKTPSERDTQTLIINLRNIKKITLTSDGNLVIEFNKSVSEGQKDQTITAEQINKSQELQTIKSYCQKNGRTSLSQQELSRIINANTTATQKPKDGNNALLIGSIGVTLIIGVSIGLLLKKKKVKKN